MERLTTTPGIAHASAMRLLGELLVLPVGLKAPQWVAQAGLDPRPCESGSSVHKPRQITKTGNRHLRTALFMPALVAVQRDAQIKAFYEALVARGKKPKQAIIAVMRKLLHAIWGMLTHGQNFDPAKFYQPTTKNLPITPWTIKRVSNESKLSDGGWRRKSRNPEKAPPPASVRWSAWLGRDDVEDTRVRNIPRPRQRECVGNDPIG